MGSNRVPRHRLPNAWLAKLAAGEATAEITRYLWVTERSRRLLLVSTLLEEIERVGPLAGPLPPVDSVWEALAAAERAAPSAVEELLLDPGVGSGCAYALRRLRGADPANWLDFGTPYSLALVAAAAAGLTWSTRLPVRDGTVMLAGRGMARIPRTVAEPFVEATAGGGRIRLRAGGHELLIPGHEADIEPGEGGIEPGEGGIGWWPLRRVRVGADLPLTVRLDDLDPFRDLADPVPPARLGAEAFARWSTLLADAWELLCRDHRPSAEAMAGGVVTLAPLRHEPGWETRSASNGEAFGSIMVSEPPDQVTLAVSLVHEYQHILLGGLLHLIRLTEPDDGTVYYAPWRDDPRPLAGLVQGVYAFYGIARFWRERSLATTGEEAANAQFEFAYARRQTQESLDIALRAPGLTEEGRRFFGTLRDRAAQWTVDPVEPRVTELAELTADSHRIGWRLRHFRPEPGDVAALAGSWRADRARAGRRPGPARLATHPGLRWDQRIPAVTRRSATLGGCGTAPAADDLAAGENALVSGDPAAARAAFLTWLGAGPARTEPADTPADDEARAWVGLALSTDDPAAAGVLARRPDLVRAVCAELRTSGSAPAPPDVAAWLAPALGPDTPA